MAGTTLKTLGICMALAVGAVYYNYGTLSPCDALRETVRRQDDLARVMPDAIVDFGMTAQYGKLSPGRCLAVLVGGKAMAAPAPAAPSASQALAPGSSRAEPPTFQTAGNQAAAAINECRAKRLSGELKSFTASAQCSGPRIIEAFRKASYRYMDLVSLMVAKRAQISERLDRREMSEADANVAFQQAFSEVVTAEKMRDAARQ
ncbi:hypothetical protein JJC00_19785 [Bradyrhizobium diazoefficiens]|uniref:hypothetical protein n=1 Tax=Bradyrhizobium diazoefficiens TaxID=1355477 RepID=UPI00190BF2BE|nr:hypothetical protein [Bradyrhizobium diazoefficiens]QQO30915.1 hypothetical protein JJC00_19785 [Bradyrhizobium diazoefficiens]